jgi:hypothetical protein
MVPIPPWEVARSLVFDDKDLATHRAEDVRRLLRNEARIDGRLAQREARVGEFGDRRGQQRVLVRRAGPQFRRTNEPAGSAAG